MKVLELKGVKGYRAFQVFHTLVLGVKMLPAYMGQSYEEFLDWVSNLDEAGQETIIREAALFVELQPDELAAIITFVTDKNGVPYSTENLKNLGPKEIHEAVVAVCCKIAKIKVDLVSDTEKKKLNDSQWTCVEPSRATLN